MKRLALLAVLALATLLLLSGTALAAPWATPFVEVSGSGSINTVTYVEPAPPADPYWSETGTATITIDARSVGKPEFRHINDDPNNEKYAVCKAAGFVTISVDDPGFETTFTARVKKLTTMWEGVHGVDIEYKLHGVTYDMYITDGAWYDTVWLGFLAPILGVGSSYAQQIVVDGGFDVTYVIPY